MSLGSIKSTPILGFTRDVDPLENYNIPHFFSPFAHKNYRTRVLAECDLPEIMALQEIAIEYLSPSQRNALVPKSREQFSERMSKLGLILGMYNEEGYLKNTLAAYGTLALPCSEWPVADMVIHRNSIPCSACHLAVIQNNVVHPAHREQGISGALISARLEICKRINRQHVMAEVSASNPASLKGFLKLGFQVVSSGVDPDDGCFLLFVHKKVGEHKSLPAKDTLSIDPVCCFNEMQNLLCQGYRGVSIQRAAGTAGGYLLDLAAPAP